MKKIRLAVGILAIAGLIAAVSVGYDVLSKTGAEPPRHEPTLGERVKAPDFAVRDAEGETVRLSDYFGKPIVLNFWASWCPPCKTEMPDFEAVYREVGGEVVFMMLNLADGRRETVESGSQYIAEEGFTFPVYFDTESEAALAYGIRSIPTTLFIDGEGYVVTGAQGAISGETLRMGIDYITD
jgi:thiol-disulfide isomerase/thioredoxin